VKSTRIPSAPPLDPATAGRQRVAVTGGLGFVGQHLCDLLLEAGHDVVVLDLGTSGQPAPAHGAHLCQVDLRAADQVRSALSNIDVVYHLAGNSSGARSVTEPLFDFETNALATLNVCAEALNAGVSRFVYLSSAMVYGRPLTTPIREDHATLPFLPYGASKLSGEHIVRAYHHTFGLNTVIGRAFTIYGPKENPLVAGGEVSQYLRWHLNHQPVQAVGILSEKTRDFIHVTDLVRAIHRIAEHGEPDGVYNLGTGCEYSLLDLIEVIGKATGRPVKVDVDESVTDDSYRHVPDITALTDLGFKPSVDLLTGIRTLADELGEAPQLPQMHTVFHASRADQERQLLDAGSAQ
jgi:UDP-glucose 4-epimerase